MFTESTNKRIKYVQLNCLNILYVHIFNEYEELHRIERKLEFCGQYVFKSLSYICISRI